jgi:hypothetical protein
MTVEQIYDERIRPLPAADQIRLASLIMRAHAGTGRLDYSEEWTEDDLREFTAAGWDLIERRLREDEDQDEHSGAG